ncbi:hypothetical protein LG299_12570 [Microbacterium lacus]|uniref:hypothetical protein n=1 Tax=Microbacterium lacus TaxID=415217 RepID=UPI00384A714A
MTALLERPAMDIGIGGQVEAWLASQPQPSIPVRYLQEDGAHKGETVPSAGDLDLRLGALDLAIGPVWGAVECGPRYAQILRVAGAHFTVEVGHHGHIERVAAIKPTTPTWLPSQGLAAQYVTGVVAGELMARGDAASIAFDWASHGSLAEGWRLRPLTDAEIDWRYRHRDDR